MGIDDKVQGQSIGICVWHLNVKVIKVFCLNVFVCTRK